MKQTQNQPSYKNLALSGLILLSPLILLLGAQPLEAKVFRNAYVSFEMPDSWKCTLEHTEWICRKDSPALPAGGEDKEAKEAIFILTAKEVGPTDTFDQYTTYLLSPQTPRKAGSIPSKVTIPPKMTKVNDQPWVDALHQGSEVSTYFTRYVATIKDKIAILVTLSAHKDSYTKYSNEFFKTVSSLRVIATKNLLAQPETGPLRPGSESLAGSIGSSMENNVGQDPLETDPNAGTGGGNKQKMKFMIIGLAAVLAALGFFIISTVKNR